MLTITISSWTGFIWWIIVCAVGFMIGEFLVGLIKGITKQNKIHIKFKPGGVMANATSHELAETTREILKQVEERLKKNEGE